MTPSLQWRVPSLFLMVTPMSRVFRIALIVALLPFAVVAWGSVVFAMDRASNAGEVIGEVSIDASRLTGLSMVEAEEVARDIERSIAEDPLPVIINGTRFDLVPTQVGFDVDEGAMIATAMEVGRTGGLSEQFRWWLTSLRNSDESLIMSPSPTVDRALIEELLAIWGELAIDDPPFEGAVRVEGVDIIAEYPRPGTGLDVTAGADLVEAALLGMSRDAVELPTLVIEPTGTAAEFDAIEIEAKALIEDLVSKPVTLSLIAPAVEVTFPSELLRDALVVSIIHDPDPRIVVGLERTPFLRYLDPLRPELEIAPVDAQVVILADETPAVIPGRSGTLIDDEAIVPSVLTAARRDNRTALLPFAAGRDAEFTTEEAEALGIRRLLYRAVTFFNCCGDQKNLNRINNIQLIADEADGAIVMPGETFSLNDYVGRRTEAEGYARAGAIIGDEVYCCDHPANVGGGVSQFTTTLYNAVFFSGLEDISHRPHSLYITRYPEVREATLGFPEPDLVFRNDTDNAILIDTEHTNTSVTVRFFGDNGDLVVEAELGSRTNFTTPREAFEPDSSVNPGDQKMGDRGSPGWTNSVKRIITRPDGSQTTESWTWRYDPFPAVTLVHPCELPEDHEEFDQSVRCPVEVPDVIGRGLASATQALNARGLLIERGDPILAPGFGGVVARQSLAAGTFAEPGTIVVVRIGRENPSDEGAG